jgi:hypothetical protein
MLPCLSLYRLWTLVLLELTRLNCHRSYWCCFVWTGSLDADMSVYFSTWKGDSDIFDQLQVPWCLKWYVCLLLYLDSDIFDQLQVPCRCWHSWTVTSTWCWRSWMITDTWMLTCLNCYRYLGVLTCLNCYRYLDVNMSELLQVPGCWHVWIVTGTFGCWHVWAVTGTLVLTRMSCYRNLGGDMSELLQIPWCWHVWIVTGTLVLTCLNCCRFLGADMSELLQVPGCWHLYSSTTLESTCVLHPTWTQCPPCSQSCQVGSLHLSKQWKYIKENI